MTEERRKKIIDEAKGIQRHYTSTFFASIFFAYTQSLEVFDMAEEAGLVKHDVKKAFKQYDKLFLQKLTSLKLKSTHSFWGLLNDFGVKYNNNLQQDLLYLNFACKNVLDKLHKENSLVLGCAEAVSIIWLVAVTNIEKIFAESCRRVGYNIQENEVFEYTRISSIKVAWDRFASLLAKESDEVIFDKDKRVLSCVENIATKMYSAKTIYSADSSAFELNKKYLTDEFGEELVKQAENKLEQRNV